MAIPITVTVIQPPRGPAVLLAKYRTPITISAIIIAGVALTLILLSGRLRMPSMRAAQAAHRADADPLTQSVKAAGESTEPAVVEKKKRSTTKSKPRKSNTGLRPRVEAAASLIC